MMRFHRLFVFCLFALLVLSSGQSLAQVFRNPHRIPTAFTPSRLYVADLNGDGRPDLVYVLSQTGSNVIHPLLSRPDGTFAEMPSIQVTGTVSNCLVADFNGDHHQDLYCVTYNYAAYSGQLNSYSFTLLGRGDGTFSPLMSLQEFDNASMIPVAAGDLNHDGISDVVLSRTQSDQYPALLPMLGAGDGTFHTGTAVTIPSDAFSATVVDLNGDGNPDLYFGQILFGRGDGTFSNLTGTPGGMLQDVDNDGILDLLSSSGLASLVAYRGLGGGSFDANHPIINQDFPANSLGDGTRANFQRVIAYQDVNGDGIPDVLAASGDGLTVLLGQPGLHFSVGSHAPTGNDLNDGLLAYRTAYVVDMDGDGQPDIVVPGPNGIYISYGRPNGTFASADVYEAGANITSGVVADFNGDGTPDVITAGDRQLNLSLGKGDGSFRTAQPIAGTALYDSAYQRENAFPIVHGDFNGDGYQDLLVTVSTDAAYGTQPELFLGRGDGTFQPPITTPAEAAIYNQRSVADFNADGRSDFSLATYDTFNGGGSVTTYLGQPNGTFLKQTTAYPGGPTLFADMDGDGRLDLISVFGSTLTIMPGRGDGTFAPATCTLALAAGSRVIDLATGDFDGDGHPDLGLLMQYPDSPDTFLVRYYSNGYPAFSQPALTTVIRAPGDATTTVRLQAADLNGDGRDDLLFDDSDSFYTEHGPGINFVQGNADRTVSAQQTVIAGNTLLFLTAIDLNGDKRLDLIAGNGDYNEPANSFTVLLNLGNSPQVSGTLFAAPEPSQVSAPFQLSARLVPPTGSSGTALQGSVTFAVDNVVVGSAPLVANTATIAGPATLARGTHSLTASWPGQPAAGITPAFAALTLTGAHTVVGQPSTTTLSASATQVAAGTPITFTATTTEQGGNTPDLGKLQILEGATPLGSSAASSNSITATVTFAPGTTHTLTASFAGDANAEPSASAPVTVTVAPLATAVNINFNPNPGLAFRPVQATARVTFTPLPSILPGGFVSFRVNGQALATPQLDSTGAATQSLSLSTGSYTIHAEYTSSNGSAASSSADATLTIARAPVVLSLQQPLPQPYPQSAPPTLGVLLDDGTTRHLATGTIVPTLDGIPQPALPVPPAGTLAYQPTSLAPGDHTLQFTYSGDSNFLSASTATVTLTVLRRDFAISGGPALTIPTQHYRSLPLQVTSLGDFAGPVALTCADLPQFASCRFSLVPVQLASGGSIAVKVTVDTSALPGYLASTQRPTSRILAAALAPCVLLLLFAGRRRPRIATLLLLSLMFSTALMLEGCSDQYPAFTPPGTYIIRVVGQSTDTGGTTASLTHSQQIVLTVTR